ncbi:ATP-binding protein [Klebsiella sp. BIGb0407]|uniref:ATP-binding protein n=1 Tax=Klebsiella sp. BIGb0407 TaxID=2940603 RepID=UPI0021681208|nr:ATP-binding protein [Klebsiella sp. BIGb0407]MCS3433665.1 AAA15 family ATPase/GTPase [Klebsiella sp. BIGb0407]
MSNHITKIKQIKIINFRGLNNCIINFGERITAICGKNGTSKSTILGIAAQMFNFETDYTKKPTVNLKEYKSLAGRPFVSQFSEHFRLSITHDTPSSMSVDVSIYDGAEDKVLDKLKLGLYLRSNHSSPRATVRNNTTTNGASDSRKVTHPVIYLSMKRLTPVPDRQKYDVSSIDSYMMENKNEFISLSSYILGVRDSNTLTKTAGTINSMVVSGEKYDHQSVSVGEDNLGQILQAIFSFRKLKDEYPDYHGGMLLIDELDAGLFPAAQRRLLEKMCSLSRELNIQIIFTTHSPELINNIANLSKNDAEKYKLIYLTNTYGALEAKEGYSWADIKLDLFNETIQLNDKEKIKKTNVFFEDKENFDFYSALVTRRDLNRLLNPYKDITLGCENYLQLLSKKVPGFYQSAIIVLDGDVKKTKYENVIKLPTNLPPDQLIFEFLYNLDSSDDFWKNEIKYTKSYFFEKTISIIDALGLTENKIDLTVKINNMDKSKLKGITLRVLFKKFTEEQSFQYLVSNGGVNFNPYRRWANDNPLLVDKFNTSLVESLRFVIGAELGVECDKLKSMLSK